MTTGLSLAELGRELRGSVDIVGDAHVRVTGVHHDSRRVSAGDLFVARRGGSQDGTKFVDDALRRGAVAVLAERAPLAGLSVPQIIVGDERTAMAFAAEAVYGHPAFSLEIVGITGTNGKTTTSHLVRAAIDAAVGEPSCGIVGTLGHSFGDWSVPAAHTTPEADELSRVLLAMRERKAAHVVMEVSSIALELKRVEAIRFRVAAFTNLTQDHLDFHKSMDAYGAAKARLFLDFGPGGAVVNVDDPFGRALAERLQRPIRTSARDDFDAEVVPTFTSLDRHALKARFRTPSGKVDIESRLVGGHNLENIATALGIVCALELDVERAAMGLSAYAGVPGRLERCDAPGDDVTVLVDYAHTPDALVRALAATRTASEGRLFCVFGCGGDRDASKRGPMGRAAALGADIVVVTSDNPRTEDPALIAAAAAAGARAEGLSDLAASELGVAARGLLVEVDRERAIDLAVLAAAPGDAILIAGKGHEDYQVVGHQKLPFDDRVVARAALGRRRGR